MPLIPYDAQPRADPEETRQTRRHRSTGMHQPDAADAAGT